MILTEPVRNVGKTVGGDVKKLKNFRWFSFLYYHSKGIVA